MMADGDKPPVGILLCTQKDHALVEYALAGMDTTTCSSPSTSLNRPARKKYRNFWKRR